LVVRSHLGSPRVADVAKRLRQTNYCTSAFATVPYTHEDAAPLLLLGQALSTAFLHREIREKGGAYGGGASASPLSGRFGFTSYRDPNTIQTLDTFVSAAEWAASKGNITAAELEEAHLRAFKSLDAPLAPSSRGSALFSSRLTDDARQVFRDRLLSCTAEKMRDVAERYLLSASIRPALAIVGAPSAASALQAAGGWTVLDAEGNPLGNIN
jgi:Zn-dependent M16 (insulinase) family peptidase